MRTSALLDLLFSQIKILLLSIKTINLDAFLDKIFENECENNEIIEEEKEKVVHSLCSVSYK